VARMGDGRDAERVLVKRPDGKRQLGRRKLKRENNTTIYLQDFECGGMEGIDLAEYRKSWRSLVNAVINFRRIFS